MKCFRCGYCCTELLAVIVVDPKVGVEDGNIRAIDLSKERCPHLRGDRCGEYTCAVHDEPWFAETPCADYQSHWGDKPCRVGEYRTRKQEGGDDGRLLPQV